MLAYTGKMPNVHLRAAIRTALTARLTAAPTRHLGEYGASWQNGGHLWQEISHWCPAAETAIDSLDMPEFRGRVPLVADLGFRQVSVFQSLLGAPSQGSGKAAFLGAVFNLAITWIDLLADELAGAERVFSLLEPGLIRGIFASPGQSGAQLQAVSRESQGAHERLLVELVALCAATGAELLRATQNRAAWRDLGEAIVILFEAERQVASSVWPSHPELQRLLPFLSAKSCWPSVAALHIARLACQPDQLSEKPELLELAKRLGMVFWRIDDLADLMDDLREGVPNAILCRLADRIAAESRPSASDKDIYDEVDRTVHELCILAAFEERAPELSRFALAVIEGWTAPESEPATLKHAVWHAAIDGTAEAALAFLLRQQKNGFEEAVHHLRFPRLIDGAVRYETRPAILSHRAVILDALLDAAERGLDCPNAVLASECMQILKAKHPDVRGGWSYIQEAPELPPDADDLGQVLQVLMRFGGHDLASICEEPLCLLLDAAEADGGFCTWILDPGAPTFAHERMRSYLGVMGGWGVHPEVVANLLYGLCLFDPRRYRDPLHRAIGYLEKVQDPDGSWTSKWYTGRFYGTWRAVSVLGRVAPSSRALAQARGFLISSRHAGGSWGERESDPLSTALAMLALSEHGMEPEAEALSAGLRYLGLQQRPDGAWPSCPWIAFPTVDGPVVHGSASATTAFCLKAWIAANRILGPGFQSAYTPALEQESR